jgi:hypothetical protein
MQFIPQRKHNASHYKDQMVSLMIFREIISVCSENHTKPTNTLRKQNAELLNVKVSGIYVTTGLLNSYNDIYLVNNFAFAYN